MTRPSCRLLRPIQTLWVPLLVLPLLVSFVSSCTRRGPPQDEALELSVSLAVSPSPASTGASVVVVTLLDGSRAPVQGADLRLHGDMTHAGMVPLDVALQEQAPGTYLASLDLSMAGDWVLAVRGDLSDGRKLVREFPLSVAPAQP